MKDEQTMTPQTLSAVLKLKPGVILNEEGKRVKGTKIKDEKRMTLQDYFSKVSQQSKARYQGNKQIEQNVLHQSLEIDSLKFR